MRWARYCWEIRGLQKPIYYLSKTLVDAETRYLPLEKLALAPVHVTRKLPHYFQAYTVYVLTKYPLQSSLKRSDFMGRTLKWGTRLGSFDIHIIGLEVRLKARFLPTLLQSLASKRSWDGVPCGGSTMEGVCRRCILCHGFGAMSCVGNTERNKSRAFI